LRPHFELLAQEAERLQQGRPLFLENSHVPLQEVRDVVVDRELGSVAQLVLGGQIFEAGKDP
jgi:hypothetical protein